MSRTADRRAARALALAVLGAGLAGCGGGDGLRCAASGDYAQSGTAPPVRVPEGLSVPSEEDALTIPSREGADGDEEAEQSGCLERPPDYFEGGQPQGAAGSG